MIALLVFLLAVNPTTGEPSHTKTVLIYYPL